MNLETLMAQGPVDVNVSQHCDCDHHETCEVCVPSLYEPKKEVVRLTADGVNRIGDTIAELRMENAQLLAALEATSNAEQTKEAAGHRLALELECLLLDCKDNVVVSRWMDTACEALDAWQRLFPYNGPRLGD